MRREFIISDFKFGEHHPFRKLYKTREEAQWVADQDNKDCPDFDLKVIEVDIDNLDNQPEAIQEHVRDLLKFRSRTFVHHAGDSYLTAIPPLATDQVKLEEGDAMIRLDPPRTD
jgi:hypothetical protein